MKLPTLAILATLTVSLGREPHWREDRQDYNYDEDRRISQELGWIEFQLMLERREEYWREVNRERERLRYKPERDYSEDTYCEDEEE